MSTSNISGRDYNFRPISSTSNDSFVSLDSPTSLDTINELSVVTSKLRFRSVSLPAFSFSDQTFLNSHRSHSLTSRIKDAGLSACLFKRPNSETLSQIEEMEEIEQENNTRKNFTKEDWLGEFFECIQHESKSKMLLFETIKNFKKAFSTLDVIYQSRENRFVKMVLDPNDYTTEFEQDFRGMTLLGHVATCGDRWQIKTLLDSGASLEFCDQDGYGPLSVAIKAGEVVNAQLLLQCGANADAVNEKNGFTPLSLACRWSEKKSMKFLNVLLPYIKNINGDSRNRPLHLTSLSGKVKLTEILLGHGADRYAKDNREQTALEVLGFYDPEKFPYKEQKHLAIGWLLSHKVPQTGNITRGSSQLEYENSKRPKLD